MKKLTRERLMEVLYYNPHVGVFEWRRSTRKVKAGQVAGSVSKSSGYVEVGIDGKVYRAHHLVWLYVNGQWPSLGIDHIDGDKTNNLLSNLREAKQFQNCWNSAMPVTNTSGIKGVSYAPRERRWVGSMKVNGDQIRKSFKTKDEAALWVKSAREQHHGEFVNHGVHKYVLEDLDGD